MCSIFYFNKSRLCTTHAVLASELIQEAIANGYSDLRFSLYIQQGFFNLFFYFLFNFFNVYLFLRQRETEHEQGRVVLTRVETQHCVSPAVSLKAGS